MLQKIKLCGKLLSYKLLAKAKSFDKNSSSGQEKIAILKDLDKYR